MKQRTDMILYAALLATLILAAAVVRQVRFANLQGAIKYEKVRIETINSQVKSGNLSHREADFYEQVK